MKKKLLENDIFYLSLFVCVCLLAVGGVWYTNKNVNNLAKNEADKNEEIHLIDNEENKEAIQTSTDSDQNLSQAKAKEEEKKPKDKLSYLGTEVTRGFSEKEPSYSETLDVWEIHKGVDISTKQNQEIKSLMNGTVMDVYKDDEYGMSVKIKHDNNIVVVYSNLSDDIKVKKDQTIQEGQCIGLSGNTTTVESKEKQHIHIEAFKGEQSIDPMSLVK
ncbi:MAG: peptidoglycan DD-metalloendopeptidase family protein [Peptostreptococcaceae bacterium]